MLVRCGWRTSPFHPASDLMTVEQESKGDAARKQPLEMGIPPRRDADGVWVCD